MGWVEGAAAWRGLVRILGSRDYLAGIEMVGRSCLKGHRRTAGVVRCGSRLGSC